MFDKLPASALLGQNNQIVTDFTPQGNLPVPLTPGECLRFHLIPTSEVITGLRLRFATYCRINHCHLTLEITAQTNCLVRFNANRLTDNQYIDITLPLPQACTSGQPVEISIYSDDATDNDMVALWCSRKMPVFVNTLELKPISLSAGSHARWVRFDNFSKVVKSIESIETSPRVSIVIPVFNKALYTYNCLLTLSTCDPEISKEVILINNASSDETTDLLAQLQGAFKVIHNQENLGFVQACRQGSAIASGEFILFLNNDTQVMPGWLSNMLKVMDADPKIGITGSKLIYPNGRLQEAGGIIFNDASGCNYGRGQDPTDSRFNQNREADYCSGASLMIRQTLWEQLGGFDMRFAPAYYEDTDLCFAARQAGYKVFYCHDSEVIHHEGITAGTNVQTGYKAYQVINHKKFRNKWRKILAAHHLPPQTAPEAAAVRLLTENHQTFRLTPNKILAVHLFGQGWAPNFWSYLNIHKLEAELNFFQSLGFNTVIILVPWVGFQPSVNPITYYEEYFTIFEQVLEKVQHSGLQIILRLGYTHDNGPESTPEGFLRQIVVGADTVMWTAWCDYLDRVWRIAKLYPNVLGGFITWEDFFFMDLTHIPPEQRLLYATHTGYQSYLEQHYSLTTISEHYQLTFSSYREVPIPAYKGQGIQLFCEFWDDLLIKHIFTGSKQHFPPLAMEVRIDCDPDGPDGLHICHHPTFDLTADSLVTMIYYSPAWRAPNDGKVESAETILKRLQLLFEHLHDNTHNAIFIDQFNFIDNTPGFEHNTGIIPDEIPHFLTGVASLLQQHTIGYGMWTLRDVPANALRNGLFERNYPSWEWGTSSEIVFDTVGQKKAAQLNQNGILSQRISYCSGVPLVKGMPFQLDFQARCPHGKTVFAVIIRRENQIIYEKEIALSGEDWQVLHLGQIPFARGDELKIENRGAPLLVSDFYLYQLRQENGIIDAAGQPKSFYQQLVSLNQQMRSGEKNPPKSFLQREDITPQVLEGVFSDLWMGKILSGLIAWPSNQGSLSFVVKAYVPETWVDYQNKLTLRLDDQQYQFSQPINKGYNEIRFGPLENTYSDEELFFELESAILVSPKQYDEQSQDGREVSMQLIEIGLIAESQL